MDLTIAFVLGLTLGGLLSVVVYVLLSGQLTDARRQAERLSRELPEIAEARARAEQEARRVPDLLAELGDHPPEG
jgi:uncharacterized membrane protein YciS (DUF1049 family)